MTVTASPRVEKEKMYFQLIDKCLGHFVENLFADELARAKGIFFENAGILDEASADFEPRMAQFFDWYFFDNELTGYGLTPLDSVGMIRGLRLMPEETEIISQLKLNRHSLFEIYKIKGNDLTLRDLLRGDKVSVPDCQYSFNAGEIFEARLLPASEGTWMFSRGFCFHPKEAQKYIQSEIKKHRKNPDYSANEMMLKLLKMKYRSERLKHVRIDMIYSDKPHYG